MFLTEKVVPVTDRNSTLLPKESIKEAEQGTGVLVLAEMGMGLCVVVMHELKLKERESDTIIVKKWDKFLKASRMNDLSLITLESENVEKFLIEN